MHNHKNPCEKRRLWSSARARQGLCYPSVIFRLSFGYLSVILRGRQKIKGAIREKKEKNAEKRYFFRERFGGFLKKQYLCTRFRESKSILKCEWCDDDFLQGMIVKIKYNFGAVVQLVRIPACHAVGREFESRPHRKVRR